MPVRRDRRRQKQKKVLVAFGAGSICGALWMLLVDVAANTIRIDTIKEWALLLIGVGAMLVVSLFLASTSESLREVVGLSLMVIGFHGLALPIAALISFVAAGAKWLPGASAEIHAVAVGVAGLVAGALLVFVGDRVLRVRRVKVRRHQRMEYAHTRRPE